jgi:hypothetical protein
MSDQTTQDLTTSDIVRQNILNNPYALEVSTWTIENYLANHETELKKNGYEVLRGKSLRDIKKILESLDVPEIDFGNIKKTPPLGIFDFRAFSNIAKHLHASVITWQLAGSTRNCCTIV